MSSNWLVFVLISCHVLNNIDEQLLLHTKAFIYLLSLAAHALSDDAVRCVHTATASFPPVMTDSSTPCPFRVEFPQEEVERMRRLLKDTRLPAAPPIPGAGWDYGVDLDWLKSMRDAWLDEYDWRAVERRMNALNHFKVTIEGIDLHYLHHKSEREDAIPILLTHGWPGLHHLHQSPSPSDH